MPVNPSPLRPKTFKVSKFQLRLLLGRSGQPMSATSWRRFYRAQQLPTALGMSDDEFSRTHYFYVKHYDILKNVLGFDDGDLEDV